MVRGSQAPDRSPTVMPLIFAGSGFSCRAHLTGLHAYGYARISTGITRQCSTPLPPPLPGAMIAHARDGEPGHIANGPRRRARHTRTVHETSKARSGGHRSARQLRSPAIAST
jgi:hypothetical protein